MERVRISLLRGNCQVPAFVAHERGLFAQAGVEVELDVVATAWQIPERLAQRQADFAILPWTRAASETAAGRRLVAVCGSGQAEAAIVVRRGLAVDEVRSVALPRRGGLKDLTALALLESLGWEGVDEVRQPSGDGAILALVGGGADAASMIEPYATMLEERGIGTIVRRTGDVFPGVPGCSLTTTGALIDSHPGVVRSVVAGFVRGVTFTRDDPESAARIAARYLGVAPDILRRALIRCPPEVNALRQESSIDAMLELMKRLGYIERLGKDWLDLTFLDGLSGARAGIS